MPEPDHSEHDGYGSSPNRGGADHRHRPRSDGASQGWHYLPMELEVGESRQRDNHAFVGIIGDLTERREPEKQREQLRQAQKMEAVGQLTGLGLSMAGS
jgi:hypothetical protein